MIEGGEVKFFKTVKKHYGFDSVWYLGCLGK